ncbi:flavin-containing monooxygenase [Xenorhabdus japonica]|uniref:Putative flavoprotein involved in K+ transport n=1 Tax=Xenorhabdus japonica TaxID=53341 RepID=A0A1I5CBB9_9GAMM|nr:NAD(P)/FAD-dependent oxidoreductase [Xenorhabdus japonica]SFN84072.1 putative flavoprotein involved in K+ transport [Xenorhabdus japonica]
MKIDCLIVGAGQAGLTLAVTLNKKKINTLILERDQHIGDVWRRRPDNMLLFTSRMMSQLPDFPLQGAPDGYPGKDEIADYLERYAHHHNLNVLTGTQVISVKHQDGLFTLTTEKKEQFSAPCLINATGANQVPIIPEMASDLSPSVQQLTADRYQNPEQFQAGSRIAVIGDGASGRQISKELSSSMQVTLFCGSPRPLVSNRVLGKDLFWWLHKSKILYADTSSLLGKIVQRRNPLPCGELTNQHLSGLNVQIAQKLVKTEHETLYDQQGKKYQIDGLIWCVGYKDATDWLTLPDISDSQGFVCESGNINGGKTAYSGLFIVGRKWLSSRSSELLLGAARDAQRVAQWVEQKLRA